MKQLLIKGPGCSGRGVRIRELSYQDLTDIVDATAKEHPDASPRAMARYEGLNGALAMIAQVTVKAGFKSKDELHAAGADAWKSVTRESLESTHEQYFNGPDMQKLASVYAQLYAVTQREVDDIMGEALDVTED